MTYDAQLCDCGHPKLAHDMDKATCRNTGPCWIGHYTDVADTRPPCRCMKFRAAPLAY